MKINLNGQWTLKNNKFNLPVSIPGSVLSCLLDSKIIEDPYFRDNEYKTAQILDDDFTFSRQFLLTKEQLKNKNYLCYDGVDTIADIYINNVLIIKNYNAHLPQKILLDNSILKEKNEIVINTFSPQKFAYNLSQKYPGFKITAFNGVYYPAIRKPHFMFGWDWGPALPDSGIYRDIYIDSTTTGILTSIRYENTFVDDGVILKIDTESIIDKDSFIKVSCDELSYEKIAELHKINEFELKINNPKLWYPNGYGKPDLYTFKFVVFNQNEQKEYIKKIGIKNIKFDFSNDEYGRNFGITINGLKIFLKGANVIPEDCILNRVTNERSNDLLTKMKDFNYNLVRIWGGGYYPNDYFLTRCDELGLMVWHDLMFACGIYDIHCQEFISSVKEEVTYQIKRIREHTSVIIVAGNNESQDGVSCFYPEYKDDYVTMFLKIIKPIIQKNCSITYLDSSPTNGEDRMFDNPNDFTYMDSHYWMVWHGKKPIDDYKNIKARLLSEFGICSFPLESCLKKEVYENEMTFDNKIFISHHKSYGASYEKMIWYVESLFNRPSNIYDFAYLANIMQGLGIRNAVNHFRRLSNMCNGTVYWQLNDVWPNQSWSSIDYDGGLKPLFYFSKKFYNPEHIYIDEINDELFVCVSNHTSKEETFKVVYELCDFENKVLDRKETDITLKQGEAIDIFKFKSSLCFLGDDKYVKASLYKGDILVNRDIYQHKLDKELICKKANITLKQVDDCTLEISSDTFTKYVGLIYDDASIILSDNYFTLLKGESVTIKTNKKLLIKDIKVKCLNNIKY